MNASRGHETINVQNIVRLAKARLIKNRSVAALKAAADELRRRNEGREGPARCRDERDKALRALETLRRGKTSLPSALQSKQLCFLHIGKTAGTSVQHMLCDAMADAEVFHNSLSGFDAASAEELATFDLVFGHFTYRHVAKFKPNRFLLTFLREPVERVISQYYFMISEPGAGDSFSSRAVSAARSLPLREFLLCQEPKVRMYTENHQTKLLASDFRSEFFADGPDTLKLAEENLTTFDLVGITEHFEASVRALSEKLRVDRVLPIKRLNVNRERSRGRPSAQIIELVRDLNKLDLALYANARSRFESTYSHFAHATV